MASRINVAVAGVGFMGLTHLRIYQQMPRVRIAAICDVSGRISGGVVRSVAGNIQQAGELKLPRDVKIVRAFEDLLTDDTVDVVDISTPTSAHASQAIAALRAGKTVLCEKPLAETAADARAVAKAAAAAKGFLMPAMCMRFWPGWSGLKEIAQKQTYGRVLAAHFRRVSARPAWGSSASHPGGALLDLHIHDTDFAQFLFGRPAKVFSRGVVGESGVVDHVVTQYIYDAGPVVTAEGSWLEARGFQMNFVLHCERATLQFDSARGPEALRITLPGKDFRVVKLRGQDGYHEEIRHFIRCVERGQSSGIVTPQDAVSALEICAAEEKSVRGGGLVKV